MRIRLLRAVFATLIILIVFDNALFAQGSLTNISVNLSSNDAGAAVVFTCTFTTSDTGNGTDVGIPSDGKIEFIFPAGFDVSGVDIVDSQNGNLTGGFLAPVIVGQSVEVTRDGVGNNVAASVEVSISIAVVVNSTAAGAYSVQIKTKTSAGGEIDAETSPQFTINSASLDHFDVSTSGNATAGDNFSVTITAQDAYNNTVTSHTAAANLSDSTGTISPSLTDAFTAGVWTGNVSFTKAFANNQITVTYNNKSGSSVGFDVQPGSLNHFDFDTIDSPKTAGISFNIRIVAHDQFHNVVTSYTDKVTLTDLSGALNTPSDYFVGGVLNNQSVIITKSRNDNYITATDAATSKTGQSNYFNVEPGSLAKFYINPVTSPQTAGSWFSINVIAQDNWDNLVTDFSNKVTISDLSGTITPTQSENFSGGQWTGNVKVSLPYTNNVITVQRLAGSETGSSNIFDVVVGSLDHFVIDNISSPQTAGTPFSITITAKDVEENTVTSFAGQVNISDLTGSISPQISTNFTNGVWTGDITITSSKTNNQILVTGSGKNGNSNEFNVDPGALSHFEISDILSPQIAGQNFTINIAAHDANENVVTSFTNSINLADLTGTISPTVTNNFTAGQWSGSVSITKKYENNRITVTDPSTGKNGVTNYFNIDPNVVHHIVIRDNPGGFGSEVGDSTFNLNDKIRLYAAGYDQWDNYVRDVIADWDTTGDIDPPSPLTGTYTIFSPTTPNTSGQIYADSVSIGADSTGLFTVGVIHHVLIRDAANGEGSVVGDKQITADETLVLYAAAYDEGNNYLGPATVDWANDGSLQPSVLGTDTMYVFSPTTARVSGKIYAAHATAPVTSTGTITVSPGAPVGTIALHPDPRIIAADPDSFTTITSDIIYDDDGNAISEGELFTVSTTLGSITTSDQDPAIAGHQVKSNLLSKIVFTIHAGTEGGEAVVHANSIGRGNAVGDTVVIITNIRIVSVNADYDRASQGQTDIPVRLVVDNVGTENITIVNTGLKFTGPGPTYTNLSGEYNVTRTDGITQLLANTQSTLTFQVDVASDATTDTVTVDGFVSGEFSGVSVVDTSATVVDKIMIQSPPTLLIEKVEAFADTVIQGTNTTVTATIRNDGDASLIVDSDSLTFWAENLNLNVTNEYGLIPFISNPDTLIGHSSGVFNYTVQVGANASLDTITLDGKISGRDINTNNIYQDSGADQVDGWWVKQASDVEIAEFTASQTTVTNEQQEDWFLNMVVINAGGADLKLDSVAVKFSVGGSDISSEYKLMKPGAFQKSGDDTLRAGETDTLKIIVDETGSTLGTITITGTLYLNDMISGQIIKTSATGVTVQSPAQLAIDYIHTSQSEVTIGQAYPWQIIVSLTNNGGGDIAIDSTTVDDFISFSDDTSFALSPPSGFYSNNNFVLKSGKTDSLFFTVDTTGVLSGLRKIYVNILARELNSQRLITADDSSTIRVETPANIRIKSTENVAPNAPYVDREQNFQIKVVAENIGEDAAKDIEISMASDSSSTILNPTETISLLEKGKADTVTFNIRAASNSIFDEIFSVRIDTALAENTPEADKILIGAPIDSFTVATVQQPALLTIVAVESSSDTVKALSTENWYITVAIKNEGEATLTLNKPAKEDIAVIISGVVQGDYSLIAPDGFKNSPDLSLSAGEEDTLIYVVDKTGFYGGIADLRVTLSGVYLNKAEMFQVADSTQIYVRPSADIFVNITEPVCPNIDQYGIGHVNEGQTFSVRATIKNAGAERVDQVIVKLTSPGYTISPDTINYIPPSGDSVAIFNITALTVSDQVEFMANIVSATTHESGLPAAIGASSDSTAYVQVHKPALLKLYIDRSDSIFSAGQTNKFKLSVLNLGTAEVDDSGLLAVQVPANYFIIKGANAVSADTVNFVVDEPLNWLVLAPNFASTNDTIKVVILNPPKDKNTGLISMVESPFDKLIVTTIPSNISIQLFEITSPAGAIDDTLSTRQDFNVALEINTSENIDSVTATITLPEGFDFDVGVEATQEIPFSTASWKLEAPELATSAPVWIKVAVTGKSDGQAETVGDSIAVFVQRRAEIVFDRIWTSSQRDSIFSTGQLFTLYTIIKSKNANQAGVEGSAMLRIDFGSTGITTEEFLIKPFKVDSVVTWHLKAPDVKTDRRPVTIYMESTPLDENTNQPAFVWDDRTWLDFYVETVSSVNITVDNFRITSPYGATDNVLSSYQTFAIEAFVNWQNCADLPSVKLELPPGFTTAESNPKNPPDTGQQGKVTWNIQAPGTAVADQHIWLNLSAHDANSGELFAVNSDSLKIDVVNRAEVQLNAQIISPPSALDRIISAGDQFVVSAYLTQSGDANLVGNYSATLTLPEGQGYSTSQNLTLSANYDQAVQWTVQAPYSARDAANMDIVLTKAPKDENTDEDVALEAIISKKVSIPISTEEKSVIISMLPQIGSNTIARGDTAVTMLVLNFEVSGDEFSNNVLFSGVKLKLKNRLGVPLDDPRSAVSRISIVKYQESSTVYGQLTDIPSSNPIEISFSQIDTLKPEILNRVAFKVDVSPQATISDFQIAIDSSNAFQLIDEGSGKPPIIKNESGVSAEALDITSTPSVIIESDFKKSFRNYPNPFGNSERPRTYFVYYLEEDSDVKIQIYTLIGELVWSRSYSKNDPQGRKGTHNGDISWDARNDRGHKVLNGVYVARISIGNKDSIAKIAVIK